MQCRQCGTEIADKAIICYRCGAATTDPVRRAVQIRRTRSPLLSFVVLALLVLLALYQGYAYKTAAAPQSIQLYAGIVTGVALLILLFRVLRRGR